MRTGVVIATIFSMALGMRGTFAQEAPFLPRPGVYVKPSATGPGATRPGAEPSTSWSPKNIDKVLDDLLTLDADKTTLGEFIGTIQRVTQTNIAMNWNAFKAAGVTRETRLSFHVKELSYENVVRTLGDILPSAIGPAGKLNYTVEDNTITLTTNAELGKSTTLHLIDAGPYLMSPLAGESVTADDRGKLLADVVRAEMSRAGEPMDVKEHAVEYKEGALVVSVSERAENLVERVQGMLTNPIKPGQNGPGLIATGSYKRTAELLAKVVPEGKITPEFALAAARDAKKAGGVNVVMMLGTEEELAKEKPLVAGLINESGVLVVGPAEAVRARTFFAVYDGREPIKKVAAKEKLSTFAAEASLILQLEAKVPADAGSGATWGGPADLAKGAGAGRWIIVPYGGLLVVFATADAQRQLSAALLELDK